MRRGNPRRDALEYGILISLTTVMVGAMGLMILAEKPKDRKVDLNKPVNFDQLWKEVQTLQSRSFKGEKGSGNDESK